MEWLKRIRRDRRGKELLPLVPEMKKYVSDRYEPKVQHSIGRGIRYSLPISSVSGENKPGPAILENSIFNVAIIFLHMLDFLGLDVDEIVNYKMTKNEAKYPVEKAKGSAAKYMEL